MEIVQKDIGEWAKVEVEATAGMIQASVKVPVIELVKKAAEMAKAKIPGSIDDVIIDAIVAEIAILLK